MGLPVHAALGRCT